MFNELPMAPRYLNSLDIFNLLPSYHYGTIQVRTKSFACEFLRPRRSLQRDNTSCAEVRIPRRAFAFYLAKKFLLSKGLLVKVQTTERTNGFGDIMHYVLLFLEGIITFISPCLLPLLPMYISLFAAGKALELEDDKTSVKMSQKRTLVNATGFVTGFTIVFVILGAFAGSVGQLLHDYTTTVNIITGAIVIIFGLNYLGILNIKLLNRSSDKSAFIDKLGRDLSFKSACVFGIVFSIAWTPCIGAFLGSALMRATIVGNIFGGMLMLFVYSLGLAIPFIISAVLIDRLKSTFNLIKGNYRVITLISGSLLVVIGILMMTGLMGRYLALMSF